MADDRNASWATGSYGVDMTPGRATVRKPGCLPVQRRAVKPGWWLGLSLAALGVLAGAAAAVSYSAQYRMVDAAKRSVPSAALEAGIPDVAALIFAALGIALALHGRRALRPRALNICAVATSVAMNVLAAGHGWRDLAIWAMPPVAYALASDTAIGVVRAWSIARQRALNEALADDDATPLAVIGGLLLWLLRLGFAPASTLGGFRRWVIEECPVAPGRHGIGATGAAAGETTARDVTLRPAGVLARGTADTTSSATAQPLKPESTTVGPANSEPAKTQPAKPSKAEPTKTQRFLDLVADRYGPLGAFPIANVSRVCTELAPEADLNVGAARTALRRHVLAAQNGALS